MEIVLSVIVHVLVAPAIAAALLPFIPTIWIVGVCPIFGHYLKTKFGVEPLAKRVAIFYVFSSVLLLPWFGYVQKLIHDPKSLLPTVESTGFVCLIGWSVFSLTVLPRLRKTRLGKTIEIKLTNRAYAAWGRFRFAILSNFNVLKSSQD